MVNPFRSIKKYLFSVPICLLVVSILAYGLLIPFLGYYFDDWMVLWLAETKGNFWEFYAYDRPFSAWTFLFLLPILKTNSLAWHIFMLFLRWLTACSAWWVLRWLWPKKKVTAALIALLFTVYPVFKQSPISIAYSQHFITYILFLLSVGLMIKSLGENHRRFWLFSGLAMITQVLHIFTMEYFWGIELIRPVIIFHVLKQRDNKGFRFSFYHILRFWLPYLLIFLFAVIWRIFLFSPVVDPNELNLVYMFLEQPSNAIIHLAQMILNDTVYVVVSTWFDTLQVSLFNISDRFLLMTWLVVGLGGWIVYTFLNRLGLNTFNQDNSKQNGYAQILLGIYILIVGSLPAWLINRQILDGKFSDRFAVVAILGASIVIVAILQKILSRQFYVFISMSILVGLAIGFHVRSQNEYRWEWTHQRRFYWQLLWRIPYLEPGTAIFSDGVFFNFTGDYPTSLALNLLLTPENKLYGNPLYWFFELDSGYYYDREKYLEGTQIHDELRNIRFDGWSKDSIILHYDPYRGGCLWVVGEGDGNISFLPEITLSALTLSDLNNIKPGADIDKKPLKIFGDEIERNWCFYFQKAELARQFKDWEKVVSLSKQVEDLQYSPQNGFEWRPFIDGNLHVKDYEMAYALSIRAFNVKKSTQVMICDMWNDQISLNSADANLNHYYSLVDEAINCSY